MKFDLNALVIAVNELYLGLKITHRAHGPPVFIDVLTYIQNFTLYVIIKQNVLPEYLVEAFGINSYKIGVCFNSKPMSRSRRRRTQ